MASNSSSSRVNGGNIANSDLSRPAMASNSSLGRVLPQASPPFISSPHPNQIPKHPNIENNDLSRPAMASNFSPGRVNGGNISNNDILRPTMASNSSLGRVNGGNSPSLPPSLPPSLSLSYSFHLLSF
ncbi:hypothetical protein V2J09_022078 [Rumex salicifolius]